jgi:hypothetical protein
VIIKHNQSTERSKHVVINSPRNDMLSWELNQVRALEFVRLTVFSRLYGGSASFDMLRTADTELARSLNAYTHNNIFDGHVVRGNKH